MALPQWQQTDDVLRRVAEARYHGRSVVFLVGGGVSAECGLPTTPELVRQIAAFSLYVRKQAFLPQKLRQRPPGELNDRLGPLNAALYRYHRRGLLAYVEEHNWTDPRQVTGDLWAWYQDEHGPRGLAQHWAVDPVVDQVERELDRLAEEFYPERVAALRAEFPEDWEPAAGSLWNATGDWKDLLRRMTGFKPDLAAQLFTRLHRLPRPGLGHQFLAFLVRILGVRQFLTVGQDTLLEQALASEGVAHSEFPLDASRPYPSPLELDDGVSVIQLHGRTERLLADERLDHLVDPALVARMWPTLHPQALLLVVGCTAPDRWLTSLVEQAFLEKPDRERGKSAQYRGPAPRVIWVHTEDRPPFPAPELAARLKREDRENLVMTAAIQSPSLFLRHMYEALTSRHPASVTGYSAHAEGPTLHDADTAMPLIFRAPVDGNASHSDDEVLLYKDTTGSFFLFDNRGRKKDSTTPTASERLAQWMNSQKGFVPIWIDLEGQYTIPGVVGAIIDQCRRYDPDLPPSVLPLRGPFRNQSDPALLDAAKRVAEALRRGRYFLALDGFELFSWPQTQHHGTSRKVEERAKAVERVDSLAQLLEAIQTLREGIGSSKIGLSVNPDRSRSGEGSNVDEQINQGVAKLQIRLEGPHPIPPLAHRVSDCPPPQLDDPFQNVLVMAPPRVVELISGPNADLAARLTLFTLSCFRRTRSLIGLRSLLSPLLAGRVSAVAFPRFGPGAEADPVLKALVDCRYLIPVEGGLYWMNRETRNRDYETHSNLTTSEMIKEFVKVGVVEAGTLAQLLLLALHHNAICRYYYFETFIPSRDPLAFFEYVYHRVSSIRYLTRLVLVLKLVTKGLAKIDDEARGREMFDRLRDVLYDERRHVPNQYHLAADDMFTCPDGSRRTADDLSGILQAAEKQRLAEIDSFRQAWSLSNTELLARIPAEQLISWCEWLIEDDLQRFETSSYASKAWTKDKPPAEGPEADRANAVQALCLELDGSATLEAIPTDASRSRESARQRIARLRRDLYFLWAQCMRERTDWAGGVRVSFRHLRDLFQPNWDVSSGTSCEPTSSDEVRIATLANTAVAEIELWEREKGPLPSLAWDSAQTITQIVSTIIAQTPSADSVTTEKFTAALTCLVDTAECFGGSGVDVSEMLTNLARITEPTQRALHLRVKLLHADWLLDQGNSDKTRRRSDHVRRSQEALRLAYDARMTARQHNRPDRGVGLHQPYFHYRSLLLTVSGQARWLLDLEDVGRAEEGFLLAYHEFELARGSIHPSPDRVVQAQTDLRAAECALAHSEFFLRTLPDVSDHAIRFEQAGAKYRVADGYLRRGLEHLLGARRNVIWWKEYFRLRATYKASKNDLRVTTLGSFPVKTRHERLSFIVPRFLRTLRHGLVSVGQGVDLELAGSLSTDSWQVRTLQRLERAAEEFTRLAFESFSDGEQHVSQDNIFRLYWEWLLNSLGVAIDKNGKLAMYYRSLEESRGPATDGDRL